MKKRILVVDDFDSTIWVIEFSLRGLDCEIIKASNGKEAFAHFDGKQVIDLLITDLNMPVMDGMELVKRVKSMPEYKKIPVIMLTTEKDPTKKREATHLNITTWMQKPFQNEALIKVVKKCLAIP